MAAIVDGRRIHEVYGTTAFVQHVEQICRALIEPHLRDDDVAVAYSLDLVHRTPAPVGATIVLTATVADVSPRKLVCEVVARHGSRIVARSTFEQRVLPATVFAGRVAEATD